MTPPLAQKLFPSGRAISIFGCIHAWPSALARNIASIATFISPGLTPQDATSAFER
jgi:hypothetical protein